MCFFRNDAKKLLGNASLLQKLKEYPKVREK
jgi:hypothetical protein